MALKSDEYFKSLTDQAKFDPRLAAFNLKTKLNFIEERLLPEMKAFVVLLNAKYPHLFSFINGSSVRKIVKHVTKSDKMDPRKKKASKKFKKSGKTSKK